MKTLKMYAGLFLLTAMFGISQINSFGQSRSELITAMIQMSESQNKKDALIKLNAMYADSKIDAEMAKEYSELIYLAKNNESSIAYAAELSAKSSRYSKILMQIAKTAAISDKETTFYRDLLELTFLKLGETEDVVYDAIKQSVAQPGSESEAKIKGEIKKLKNQSAGKNSTDVM